LLRETSFGDSGPGSRPDSPQDQANAPGEGGGLDLLGLGGNAEINENSARTKLPDAFNFDVNNITRPDDGANLSSPTDGTNNYADLNQLGGMPASTTSNGGLDDLAMLGGLSRNESPVDPFGSSNAFSAPPQNAGSGYSNANNSNAAGGDAFDGLFGGAAKPAQPNVGQANNNTQSNSLID
jgi:hypothetical protein